jgi:hypothetical protein
MLILVNLTDAVWWNTSFQYKQQITINERSNRMLTNYTLNLTIVSNNHTLADFSDLRFVDSSETYLIPYWISGITTAGSSKNASIYVKVPIIPSGSSTSIYMYYGNSTPVNSLSSFNNSFIFAYDFAPQGIDSNIWNVKNVGSSVDCSSSTYCYINVPAVNGNYYSLKTNKLFSVNTSLSFHEANNIAGENFYIRHGFMNNSESNPLNYYNGSAFTPSNSTESYIVSCNDVSGCAYSQNLLGNWKPNFLNYTIQIGDSFGYGYRNGILKTKLSGTGYTPINSPILFLSAIHQLQSDQINSYLDYVYVSNWTSPEPAYNFGSEQQFTQSGLVYSQIYNSSALLTSRQSFLLNITYNSSVYSDVNFNSFVYSGTKYYTFSKSSSGNNILFTSTINGVSPLGTNNFNWNLTLTYINSSTIEDSTISGSQSVQNFGFGLCNATLYVQGLNFTTKYEANGSIANVTNFKGTFDLFDSISLLTNNYSFNILNDADGKFNFCFDNNYSLKINANIQYDKTGYSIRNYLLNNVQSDYTQAKLIDLYLLENTQTDLVVRVLDANLFVQPNIFVKMQRYYPDSNSWIQVDMGKTDDLGQTITHVIEKDVDYRFIFEKEGAILRTTNPMKILCLQDPCQVEFIVGGSLGDLPFKSIEGFTYSLIFDNNTKKVRFEWSDVTGVTPTLRLNVQNLNMSTISGKNTICNNELSATSGVMYCDLSNNTGTFFAQIFRKASPEQWIDGATYTIIQSLKNTFGGNTGLFLSLILIITLGLTALWNPVVAISLSLFGFIAVALFGIITLSYFAIISLVLMGIIMIIYMRS